MIKFMPVHGIFTRKDVKTREISGDHYLEAQQAKPPTILISARGRDRRFRQQWVGKRSSPLPENCINRNDPGFLRS